MKGDLERVPKKANKQKKVVIKDRVKCDKEHIYTTVNIESLTHAMTDLTHGSGLEVWLYLVKNQQGYDSDLSSKDARDNFGIAEKRFQNGVKELIEKGYLNWIDTPYGNSWEFVEYPKTEEDPSSKIDEAPSSKINEGFIQNGVRGSSKTDEGSIQNERTNITYNTLDTTETTKETIMESSSSIVGDALPGLTPPQSEESSKQKEEELGSEEPAVCPSVEPIEQAEEQPEPDLTAIPFPLDRCIEKDAETLKSLTKQYGSPEQYECGDYIYFAFACVPEHSSAKYGKIKKSN